MEYTCKDAIEMLADVATVIIATIAVYYAWKTYQIAKEAKDEWKKEKNLDVLVRFSKVFPSSRECILNLRSPLSFEHEVEEGMIYIKAKGDKISLENSESFSSYFVVQSRYSNYELKLNEMFDLEHEVLFLLGKDNVITKYIAFIKETKTDILHSAQQIGYYNGYLNDRTIGSEERIMFREKRREHIDILYSVGDDKITNNLKKAYCECDTFLKSHQAKFKLN